MNGTFDHKKLLASLSDDARIALTEKSDWKGLVHLLGYLSALLVTSVWIFNAFPFWQPVLLVQGILLVFLFTLLHETVHFTPFKSDWLNTAVGRICGFIIVIPPLWFRYFHLAHHRYTHDPDRDPELEAAKPETLTQYAWYLTGIAVWWSQLRTVLNCASGRLSYSYLPENARARVVAEARIMLLAYSGVAALSFVFSTSVAIWLWILPLLIGQPFLRFYLMAEHGRCPHVANMLENTRTTITTRVVRWLAWNMPYHIEHHTYPAVPFHKLPEFHRYTRDHIKVQSDGYSGFHRETLSAMLTDQN